MSAFKDMVERDVKKVFLNTDEYAEERDIIYDGVRYKDVDSVLADIKEEDRRQLVSDRLEGLYLVSAVLHCAADDIGGSAPEKGSRIKIRDEGFMREFRVASSICELGMVCAELEAIDE